MRMLIMAGDGVGSELMPEVRRVVDWFVAHRDLILELHEEPFGIASWRERGTLMSDETWDRIETADAILFGAIGSPEYEDLPPAARQVDWLLEIRRSLDLFENRRPVSVYDALADLSPLRSEVVRGVDLVIVRELVAGAYFGEPRGIESLADGTRRAVNTIAYTTAEIERVARAAFELARSRRGQVCSVDKANVLETGTLWRETVSTVHAGDYSDVELTHMYVDNCAMQLGRDPRQFDVLLTENMFGDILSDAAAVLTGSLGMVPSASLGPPDGQGRRPALYEPIHGSAPDLAGRGVANPLGAILSFAMCLRLTLARPDEARLLEDSVRAAVERGARTADIAGPRTRAISTSEMTEAVLVELERASGTGA